MDGEVISRMTHFHLARARLAAMGAERLVAPLLSDTEAIWSVDSTLGTSLADMHLVVSGTRRLVEEWLDGDLEEPVLDLVLSTLQQANINGWARANGMDLAHYYLLVDAVDTVIGDRLMNGMSIAVSMAETAIDSLQDVQYSLADEGAHCASALTNGNLMLAAHVLLGAAHLALNEAA